MPHFCRFIALASDDELPRPRWYGESDIEREERRVTRFLPLAAGVAIAVMLALVWHVL